jgi:transglutaminase-like putative cysteine protease
MVVLLYVHPSRCSTIQTPERFEVEPRVPNSEFVDSFGNRCGRLFVPAGRVVLRNDATVEDSGQPGPQVRHAPQHDVQDLPNEVLLFLLASRYCEVDSELKDLAGTLFNSTPPGWPRVQSICNFVYQHVRFDHQQARANRTALETFRERSVRLPRLHASGHHPVPLHEHSGPLPHLLSRRHRRTTVVGFDGF